MVGVLEAVFIAPQLFSVRLLEVEFHCLYRASEPSPFHRMSPFTGVMNCLSWIAVSLEQVAYVAIM